MPSSRTTQRNPRTPAAEVRHALIAAGRRILERGGTAALTVRAVASEAGVAPMGVYNHFDGKDGLLDAVVIDGFAEFGQAVATTDSDARERLLNSGRAYRRFALDNPNLYELMFSTECQADEEVAANAFLVFTDVICYGQAAGIIRTGTPDELAFQAWSAVHGAVGLELAKSHPPSLSAEAEFEGILAFTARGLAPTPD